MTDWFLEKRYELFLKKRKALLLYGFSFQKILLYDEKILDKMRGIFYKNLPLSIILLSRNLCDGQCYLMSSLASTIFLFNDEIEMNLLQLTTDELRLNPIYANGCESDWEHAVVEIRYQNGKTYIIDTTPGLIMEKGLYWLMQNPKINRTYTKKQIIDLYKSRTNKTVKDDNTDEEYTLKYIEEHLPNDMSIYSINGMLQSEIVRYKNIVGEQKRINP